MDCREFSDRLETFLAGECDESQAHAAERHLDRCEECRELSAFASGSFDDVPGPVPDLASEVLARTSGSTCERAEQQLCEFVDGALGSTDHELVRMHAEHCSACDSLCGALARMAEELPLLAELEPDPRFVSDVLRATTPLDRRVSRGLASLLDACRGLMNRPRIAWEGAYLGTFVLALLFVAPGSPWADVGGKVAELARVNPVEQLREPVAEVETAVTHSAQRVWRTTGGRAFDATRIAATDTYVRIKVDLGTLWDRGASRDAKAADSSNNGQGESQ